MIKDVTLKTFLQALSIASGDEALNLVALFQRGGLTIDGIGADDLSEEEDYENN